MTMTYKTFFGVLRRKEAEAFKTWLENACFIPKIYYVGRYGDLLCIEVNGTEAQIKTAIDYYEKNLMTGCFNQPVLKSKYVS